MSLESDLVAVITPLCPRLFPDVAPYTTARPYVTYQHIGGIPLRYVDNQPADKRHTLLQVNVWADTRAAALTLARAIEEALCAATAFTARPDSELLADVDPDTDRRGCLQDFSIWSPR